MRAPSPFPTGWTVKDLLHQLGGISSDRVRLWPYPGTATEEDVLALSENEDRLCELVDGVLVEKAMGYLESVLACELIRLLGNFVHTHKLGILAGPDGALRLMPGLIRIPDVSFIAWARLPDRTILQHAIPEMGPDLAVEVLSESNTPAEMDRKVKDYFFAGARLVWLVDPRKRLIQVFTAPDQSTTLTGDSILEGGNVLPGFRLGLGELFAQD